VSRTLRTFPVVGSVWSVLPAILSHTWRRVPGNRVNFMLSNILLQCSAHLKSPLWRYKQNECPSRWPRGLSREFSAVSLLGMRFRIPLVYGSLLQRIPTVCVYQWVWSGIKITLYTTSEWVEEVRIKKKC